MACVADLWRSTFSEWLAAAGLALGTGLLTGLVSRGASALSARVPGAYVFGGWVLASIGVGAWLAQALGAPAKLSGPYRSLAILVCIASLAGSTALGAALGYLQPYAGQLLGRANRWTRRGRHLAVAALVLTAGLLSIVDRSLFVGLYPPAHAGLRVAALACLIQALLLVQLPTPRMISRRFELLGGLFGGALACAGWLQADSQSRAELAVQPYPALYLALARTLSDFDRDGASALLGADCNEFDGSVHSGRMEIAGNGIDDNCRLGDADPGSYLRRLELPELPTSSSPANVVLIVVDALRPDRTSVYGYASDTTPNLRRWSQGARVFERAYTAGGWTGISLPPMMLGVWARRLRWTEFYYTLPYLRFLRVPLAVPTLRGERPKEVLTFASDDPSHPLSALLGRRGMSTLAVVDDGAGEILWSGHFSRGFDLYLETDALPPVKRNDSGTVDLALHALQQRPRDRPFFAWIHLFGVHAPSTSHPELEPPADNESARYDHEVRFADVQLGRLLDGIAGLDSVLPTNVILSGDHGERFGADGFRQHGYTIERDDVRVPLIAAGPGFEPGRVNTPASTVDIATTILALTGTPAPPGLDGVDLRALPIDETRVVMTDTWRYPAGVERTVDLTAALDGTLMLVRDMRTNTDRVSEEATGRVVRGTERRAEIGVLERALNLYLEDMAPPPVEASVALAGP